MFSWIPDILNTSTSRTRAATATTSTTPVPATTAAALRSRPDRVKCHQCGSLFSGSDSPSCEGWVPGDPTQQAYCQPGEACLWYSWQQSSDFTSVIRECLSTSILLGSIEAPLLPAALCRGQDISDNGDGSIQACLCESDLCNENSNDHSPRRVESSVKTSETNTRGNTEKDKSSVVVTVEKSADRSKLQVLCYQCGSLFSDSGRPIR